MEKVPEIRLPRQQGYGAAEIKLAIRRNTYKAFIFTMAGLALVLALSLFTGSVVSQDNKYRVSGPIMLTTPKEPEKNKKEESKQKIDIPELPKDLLPPDGNHGPKEVMSRVLHGVDESELDTNVVIAAINENDRAGSKPGEGIDDGTEEIEINTGFVPELPEIAELTIDSVQQKPDWFPEVQPTVDLAELRKNIVFPELARKVGNGGKVVVKVWINEKGDPEDVVLLKSESKLLEAEVLRVVKLPVYTPAINQGKPVGCWIVIPINFTITE